MNTKAQNTQHQSNINRPLVDTEELAAEIGFSSGYIRNLRCLGVGINNSEKQIPYIKRGRKVLYDLHEVTKYIDSLDHHVA